MSNENKEELNGKDLFRKWLSVPHYLRRTDGVKIEVAELIDGKTIKRELEKSDFCFIGDKVPNCGMISYVGISEIIKEIDALKSQLDMSRNTVADVLAEKLEADRLLQKAVDIFDTALSFERDQFDVDGLNLIEEIRSSVGGSK